MTDLPPRHFRTDADVVRIGEGLLARALPRAEWTHEAHLAATLWLVCARPDLTLETVLPGVIRAYNESVGGVNDDAQGYHETITQAMIAAVRGFDRRTGREAPLHVSVNALLDAPEGRRDWPLGFYSRDLLFSVAARRGFVAPDLAPLPAIG